MNRKKILALLLAALLMACLLSGCAPEDTGTLKLGGIAPMTGDLAVYGTSLQQGAQLAAEELSALGGIQIQIRYEDAGTDVEKSVAAYQTLKEWGMKAFLGAATSAPAIATSELSCADRIFSLNPTASSLEVVGGTVATIRRGNVFQLNVSDTKLGDFSARYIKDHGLGAKVAVLYQSDDACSAGSFTAFKAAADEIGLSIVSALSFTADSNADFSAQLTAARDSGADLLFLPVYYDAAARVLTQADQLDYSPVFFGTDGLDGILDAEDFDPALAEGVLFLSSFVTSTPDEATTEFIETYQAKYGEAPNQFAAAAYDAVYAIYGSLTLAKCTTDMPAEEISDAISALFTESLVLTGLTGEDMRWNVTGTVAKEPSVAVVRNGAYAGME